MNYQTAWWRHQMETSLIARFMGSIWGPSGVERTQVGPLLAPWTLLSGLFRVTGPLCGEFTVPGEFPSQRPVTQSFDVFFINVRTNVWINHRDAGDLRRYRTHYNVTAMGTYKPNLDPLLWVAILVSNGGCWDWLARTSGQLWRNWAWERSC